MGPERRGIRTFGTRVTRTTVLETAARSTSDAPCSRTRSEANEWRRSYGRGRPRSSACVTAWKWTLAPGVPVAGMPQRVLFTAEQEAAARCCGEVPDLRAVQGLRDKPTAGFEPATPSLRVKCSTS